MHRGYRTLVTCAAAVEQRAVKPESEVPGMSAYLDSLRWNNDGLVAVIAQVRLAIATKLPAGLAAGRPCLPPDSRCCCWHADGFPRLCAF
jgi:hypothetical protein